MAMVPIPPSGGNFEPTPEGGHVARCYRIIDLGTQEIQIKGQNKPKMQHKLLFSWELPDTRITPTEENENPGCHTVHKRVTFSLHEKSTMRPMLRSWVPNLDLRTAEMTGEIDLESLIGRTCYINVVHEDNPKGGVFSNIGSMMPVPDAMPMPEPDKMPQYLWLDETGLNGDVFDNLSDNLTETIMKSPEYFVWNENRSGSRSEKELDQEIDKQLGKSIVPPPLTIDEIPF